MLTSARLAHLNTDLLFKLKHQEKVGRVSQSLLPFVYHSTYFKRSCIKEPAVITNFVVQFVIYEDIDIYSCIYIHTKVPLVPEAA